MKTSPEEKSMSILNTIIATFANYLKTVLTKQKRKIILRHINNIHKFTKPVRKSSKP